MPLYEYECAACHKHTEKIQKFSDSEITTCPHCGGVLKRVLSAPAISFKGGGWYADGYGNAKPVSTSEGSEGKSESGAKNTPSTSETKASSPSESSSTPAPASVPAAAPAPAASSSSDKK